MKGSAGTPATNVPEFTKNAVDGRVGGGRGGHTGHAVRSFGYAAVADAPVVKDNDLPASSEPRGFVEPVCEKGAPEISLRTEVWHVMSN